jgi:hypothetical protein
VDEQIQARHKPINSRRAIGPIGTLIRLVLGLGLVGLMVYGQLLVSRHFSPVTWAFGLVVLPAVVLVWHWWRVQRNPARFADDGPLSLGLSLALPLALYLAGLYVPAIWFSSDATLIFIGWSLVLAAIRGSGGCELLALSNWLLGRADHVACAVVSPIDYLEQRAFRA